MLQRSFIARTILLYQQVYRLARASFFFTFLLSGSIERAFQNCRIALSDYSKSRASQPSLQQFEKPGLNSSDFLISLAALVGSPSWSSRSLTYKNYQLFIQAYAQLLIDQMTFLKFLCLELVIYSLGYLFCILVFLRRLEWEESLKEWLGEGSWSCSSRTSSKGSCWECQDSLIFDLESSSQRKVGQCQCQCQFGWVQNVQPFITLDGMRVDSLCLFSQLSPRNFAFGRTVQPSFFSDDMVFKVRFDLARLDFYPASSAQIMFMHFSLAVKECKDLASLKASAMCLREREF